MSRQQRHHLPIAISGDGGALLGLGGARLVHRPLRPRVVDALRDDDPVAEVRPPVVPVSLTCFGVRPGRPQAIFHHLEGRASYVIKRIIRGK
jgi:hypothetical protein